ncbi:MAG: hypothetical protein M3541_00020 [Acidobacteriota bacterium]|nr:hypothetical protein [Acidobacteriota bacterium]
MTRTWTFKLCVPLASAALLAGCTQEVGDRAQDRTAIDHATDQQKQNPEVSLTGCVTTGVGTNQFMLRDVRPVPLAEQPTDAPSATNSTIPENTPIRLATADADQIEKLVGQTVSVTGRLSDGRNTIGTTSEPRAADEPEPRTDKSQAATDRHHSEKVREEAGPLGNRSMNNGTYPELTVTRVNGTGQKCVTGHVEDKR